MANHIRNRSSSRISRSVAGVGIAVALTLVPGMDTATAAEPAVAAANDVKAHVTRADNAVTRAIRKVHSHQRGQARTALASARRHTRQANAQAEALIGEPPTDPESDELPGPPAVLAALRLDYRVTTRLLPLFDGMRAARMLDGLRVTIQVAQTSRVSVLDPVLALPAEGEADDYADGMADTLPMYSREVAAISAALDTFALTESGRSTLTAALGEAREAEARMNAAYGGGERSAG